MISAESMAGSWLASPFLRVPLVALVVVALQSSVLTELHPFGVTADAMLLLAVCAGLLGGPEKGAVVGFAVGLLFDLVLDTPFGLSALTYCVVGYATGYVQTGVERAAWWLAMPAVLAASAAGIVLETALGTLFGLEGLVRLRMLLVVVVVGVINGLLAPVALRVMRWALLAGEGG